MTMITALKRYCVSRSVLSLLFFWVVACSMTPPTVVVDGLTISPNFISSVVQSAIRSSNGQDLVLPPPSDKMKLPKYMHTSLILIPGAFVQPEQYTDVVRAIQGESKQAVWVSIPRIQPVANPHTIGICVKDAYTRLKRLGYPGTKTFVGGHSLGGAFLRNIFDQNYVRISQVEGLLHLGCILSRESKHDRRISQLPHMVLAGDLDGLVRASRVAEDYHRFVAQKSKGSDILQHTVILVPGMNHFGYLSGEPPFMDEFRDLKGELSHEESVKHVSSSVAEFIDYHRMGGADRAAQLLTKMDRTSDYLQPIINAMKLEGSYHLDQTPCHLCEDGGEGGGKSGNCCDDCMAGSPWAAMVQREIAPEGIDYGEVKDEFHQSWWINPLHDPPFYHPNIRTDELASYSTTNASKVNSTLAMQTGVATSTDLRKIINMGTVSEPVYEKPDMYVFDAGFFSNAAIELRCKFNSRQAILQAAGIDVPHESECGTCSKINERTIQWALEQVPEPVRRRYLDRGVRLVAGKDVEHSAGPSWIWSYMDYRRVDDKTMEIDSHIMSTPLDHPVPASGGKLYCKLLSPAKALDWIYTDSLRPSTEASKFYLDVLLSPANLLKYAAEQSRRSIRDVADPFFLPKSLLRVGFGGLSLATQLNRNR